MMKKFFNLCRFFPFEREQFETYLNAMAKRGYHLKKFNSFLSEYEQRDDHLYYHVAVHETEFYNAYPDQEYIDLFEENGYHYIDKSGLFYVFTSAQQTSIYTDDDIDYELIKKQSQKLFFSQLIAIPIIFIIMFLFGFFPLSFSDFTTANGMFWPIFACLYLIVKVLTLLYYIRYFMNQKIKYSYHTCLLRSFIYQFSLLLMIIGLAIIHFQSIWVGIIYIFSCIISIIIISILSRRKSNPLIMQKFSLVIWSIGIIFAGVSIYQSLVNQNMSPPQLPFEKYELSYQEHSPFMDYYDYTVGEYDFLYYAYSLKENMSDYLLDKFIQEDDDEYVESKKDGYRIYQSSDLIIIYKNNRMLKTRVSLIQEIDTFLEELNW